MVEFVVGYEVLVIVQWSAASAERTAASVLEIGHFSCNVGLSRAPDAPCCPLLPQFCWPSLR